MTTNNQEAQVLSDEEWQRVWDARDVEPPNGQVSQKFARRLYETIAAQAKTIAGLREQVYCPGLWRCAKCKFGMVAKNLNVNAGTVTANTDPQQCPNGCGPLWRVTERENRIEMQDGYEAATLRMNELTDLERQRCHDIAIALDSGQGNECEIAKEILIGYSPTPPAAGGS